VLLELKNICVHYGKVEALDYVSFNLKSGDIVTILGANGAGKTTILKTISGLKPPTSGQIFFSDNRIDGMKAAKIVKLGIGHVPEGARIFPYLSVKENLLLGAFTRKDAEGIEKDYQEIISHFPVLADRTKQRAGTLSGGEQQMLAIGRALMCRPKLLMMDEPTIGLSPLLIDEIVKIIEYVKLNNISILLVEQNAGLALKLANRGFVLENGKIVLEGTSEELANNEALKKAYLGG